jgi:hypothetical protein
MGTWTKEQKQFEHDKGQKDGSQSKYDQPFDTLDNFISPPDVEDQQNELNREYDKGWENGYRNR